MQRKTKKAEPKIELERRSHSRASDALVAYVKRQLFEGELHPGDFLGSEGSLVEKFKIGRRTAREAIQALQGLGLVEVRAGARGGAWIAEGHPEQFAEALAVQFKLANVDLRHIFEMQHLLETTAARLAAARRTDDDVEELRAIVKEGAEVIGSQRAFQENGLAFHLCVAKSSQNPVMTPLFRALRLVTRRDGNHLTVPMRKRIQTSHEKLCQLIEKRADDEAAELMGDHVNELAITLQKLRQS